MVTNMSFWSRTRDLLRFAQESEERTPGQGVRPPSRADTPSYVSPDAALTLSTVYRAVQIHGTAAAQLGIDVFRGKVSVTPPALLVQPDLMDTRSAFVEFTVNCLALTGNAYWLITESIIDGRPVQLEALNPHEVTPLEDAKDRRVITYSYRGTTYPASKIRHLKMMRVPGQLRGLGPIQAAQVELRGAIEARDYGSLWLSESSTPEGVLSTDQVLAPGQPDMYKNIWYGRNADGTERDGAAAANIHERLRVLGNGLKYEHLMLKPADVQFLETQQFTTTQIARLLAVPASLMLAAVEGQSQNYSNVEQDWIGYARFGLMSYLREMEEAFSSLLPRGQRARFSLDDLTRTDTKTRYEAHNLALEGGWQDADEVRAKEGMPPLTETQRAAIAAHKPTTTTKEPAAA